MCCRKNANRRAQKALVASTTSQQPNNMSNGTALPGYIPYDAHAAGTAGPPLVDVFEGRRNHCCRRRRRGPLIWRLGQFIYSRTQLYQEKRQLGEGQEQGSRGLASTSIERGVYDSVPEMPPSYDKAMGTPATEKQLWADGKGL